MLEFSDWYNVLYIMMWGLNVLLICIFDVYFMIEVRYKGVKVILVVFDYVENVKFVDYWFVLYLGIDVVVV